MNINFLAPINQLGYGVASLNILEELIVGLKHDVALFPIGGATHDVPTRMKNVVKHAEVYANFFDADAPSLRVWHQNRLAEHVGRGKHIAFPFFELLQLRPDEVHHMRFNDRVIVASKWAKDVCEAHEIEGSVVAPLGVDRSIFDEDVPAERFEIDHTVFVNVGKWEVRKGHDVLISAFSRAFSPTDKVILKLAPFNPFIGEQGNAHWLRQCVNSPMARHISIQQSRFSAQDEVAKFLATSDCAVFPARAEAWNMELLEAMSCGLSCIATNYSGHTEYANAENCRLIEIDKYEDARDGVWFNGHGQWGAFGPRQEEQLIEHMRAVHRLKQLGTLVPNIAGIETAKRFNWRATAEIIVGALR